LLVFEPSSFLFQSDDTGDHLDGGRMLLLNVEETGMNLAGDNNGRSRCEEQFCVVLLCPATASSTDELANSADIPNGPV